MSQRPCLWTSINCISLRWELTLRALVSSRTLSYEGRETNANVMTASLVETPSSAMNVNEKSNQIWTPKTSVKQV